MKGKKDRRRIEWGGKGREKDGEEDRKGRRRKGGRREGWREG